MSIEMINRVWQESKLKGNELLLLLVIADHSDDAGYASVSDKTLAKRTRIPVDELDSTTAVCEEAGELKYVCDVQEGGYLYRLWFPHST